MEQEFNILVERVAEQEFNMEIVFAGEGIQVVSGVVEKTITQDLVTGRNLIPHGLGKRARIVEMWQNDDNSLKLPWQRSDDQQGSDPYNAVIIYSPEAYEQVEINIIAF